MSEKLESTSKKTTNDALEKVAKEKVENPAIIKQKERKNVKLYEDAFNQLAAYSGMKRMTRDEAILDLIQIAVDNMVDSEKNVFEFMMKQQEADNK
ncbi:hypothetical protein IRY55_00110 [Savagea sp. SN6]|uniref:Uncharacterized protein n=1 Tax=Savagea serpentis TaxID=2785297 RepID=A0A8J7KAQ8_9BACL|nr:hypothetical protein [Savagea serpentis]MBF4499747.1 hypothetical protein [Savagea serpentis]